MFRKLFFWTHLVLGLLAGLAIAIMSFTGAALAFEKEILAWAERDARRIEPPAPGAPRLTLDDLLQRVRAARPDLRIVSVAVTNDPRAAIAVGAPGNVSLYANPYTAELREGNAPRMRAFLRTMQAWHVRLNFSATPRNPGRPINAAANVVFLFLCVSGLVLWWPRVWQMRALRPSLWFVRGARGRARDWNWHNTIGFWSLPVLLVLVASGVVLSYRWAGDLVFRLAGETPPRAGAPARPAARSGEGAPGAKPAAAPAAPTAFPGFEAVFTRTVAETPAWTQIAFRFNPPLRGGTIGAETFTMTVRREGQWPLFANTTHTLDARTGAVRRTETFADQSAGQRARRWLRLLHTGEALGWPGQLIAGLACLGGCVLVWTGFALAWRRFFNGSETPAAVEPDRVGSSAR